jgi:RimJ/RimL family protein N-acetyltransferase
MAGKVGKLVRAARTQGVRATTSDVLGRIGTADRFVILRRDLRNPGPTVSCSLRFELKRVDDAALMQFKDKPYPFNRHYQYRFEYGQRNCYAAFVDNEIGALMWPLFAADNDHVVSKWRLLLADEARISSIWADPRFRGTGLMAACIERLAAYLKTRQFLYLYACTWVGNSASIKLHERLGFEVSGRATRYSFRWQTEGRGVYVRSHIPRPPVAADGSIRDFVLPDVIS